MTSVPPTQPPAAPETDESALREWAARFLVQCGPCDGGLPMRCACTTEDERPLIAALLDALDSARERVRVVEGERDAAEERLRGAYSIGAWADLTAERNREFRRAESAEAAHRALQAELEALADEAKARKAAYPNHPHWAAWDHYESDLRALLAGGEER